LGTDDAAVPTRANASRDAESQVTSSALDWMAVAVEEHGREIVEVYLQAMRKGDWRAAEALMSRIYGKPTETVVSRVPASPAHAVIASMTLEKKVQFLHRCDGEVVGAAPARAGCTDGLAPPRRTRLGVRSPFPVVERGIAVVFTLAVSSRGRASGT
jgi:hypothetical protein